MRSAAGRAVEAMDSNYRVGFGTLNDASGNFNGGDSRQFSTLTLFLFEEMFVEQKYGYAAAIGIAITVIVLIISLINFLITRRIANEDAK